MTLFHSDFPEKNLSIFAVIHFRMCFLNIMLYFSSFDQIIIAKRWLKNLKCIDFEKQKLFKKKIFYFHPERNIEM